VWGVGGGPPYAAESKGRLNEYFNKTTTFLGFRYFILLSLLKISVIVIAFKFIISVRSGYCDYTPGLQNSSYATVYTGVLERFSQFHVQYSVEW
jgi:hypothetical protein